MIMTKFKFIDSSKDEKERDEDTVETTIIKMMIFELVRNQHRASHMNVI